MLRRIVEIFNRFCSISLDLNNFVRKYDEEILFEEDFGNELNTEAGFLIDAIKSEFNKLSGMDRKFRSEIFLKINLKSQQSFLNDVHY